MAAAQFQMPDPKQMAGIPRPVTDLPDGTVSVRLIRGQLSNNLSNVPVELHVGSDVRTAKTDENGRAEFAGLPAGAPVKAVAVVDGERLESQEFPAPAAGGIRLLLVATDQSAGAPADAGAPAVSGPVVLGGQSRIVLEPGDEHVAVYYLLDIVNNGRAPVNPPMPFAFDLPAGAVGASILVGSSPKASAANGRVRVAGPFPPGRTLVQAAAQLPIEGGSMDIVQRFPADLEQLSVIVRKVGETRLASPQIARQQEVTAQGEVFITGGGGPVAAGQPIALTLDNLPHHSALPRYIALSLAALIIAAGVWLARRAEPAVPVAERRHLTARRERLFADLVRLEQERAAGRAADERYQSRRESLMSALEQVYAALDAEEDGPEPAGRAA